MSVPYLPEHLAAFQRALALAEREAAALDAIWRKFKAPPAPDKLVNLDPAADLAEKIDVLAARFARLQDHLGEKLLPRWLQLQGESVGTMLDTLNRAERLGLLSDALAWAAWRKLRNQLVHEYLQDSHALAQAIDATLQATPHLLTLIQRIRTAASQHGVTPEM